jgi:hypothetical protein
VLWFAANRCWDTLVELRADIETLLHDRAIYESPNGNFRKQMIRVAALAVAAIESYDRKREPSR